MVGWCSMGTFNDPCKMINYQKMLNIGMVINPYQSTFIGIEILLKKLMDLMVLDSECIQKKTPMDDHKSWINPYWSSIWINIYGMIYINPYNHRLIYINHLNGIYGLIWIYIYIYINPIYINPYESHVTMAYSKDAMKQRHAEELRQASDETLEVAWYSPGQIWDGSWSNMD